MKPFTTGALAGAAAGLAGAVALASRRKKAVQGPSGLIYGKAEDLSWKQVIPGVQRAILWGDPDHGPYAAFTRFDAGVEHPWHTHPSDISLVVISGAYIYRTSERELRVGPGEFIFIPAGNLHVSGADASEPTLFFEQSPGRFGLTPQPQH